MTSTTFNPPAYRRQKGGPGKPDRAFAEVRGQRVYLGAWDSPGSRAAHERLVAELRANHGALPVGVEEITVAELAIRFWRRCEGYYVRPDGSPSPELHNFKMALGPVTTLYGDALARDFGPVALKACRQAVVDRGGSRGYANKQTNRIRMMFKWAVEEQTVAPVVLQALQAVAPLKRGRCAARETEPVRPVPAAYGRAVRPHVSRQVWTMIELQRITGRRPGEVVAMRGVDLDTAGKVWTYRPEHHKTEHHGHRREVFIGPRAQAWLTWPITNCRSTG